MPSRMAWSTALVIAEPGQLPPGHTMYVISLAQGATPEIGRLGAGTASRPTALPPEVLAVWLPWPLASSGTPPTQPTAPQSLAISFGSGAAYPHSMPIGAKD